MNRTRIGWSLALSLGGLIGGLGGAPVAPSHQAVGSAMDRLRAELAAQGEAPTKVEGWDAYLNAIAQGLGAYGAAVDDAARLRALSRLDQLADGLRWTPWPPAVAVRQELEAWSGPRRALATAVEGLERSIQALPATGDPSRQENRQQWLEFVGGDLGASLQAYESAATAADRLAALDRLRKALTRIQGAHREAVWAPSWRLHGALAELFDRPNLEATADVRTLAPLFERDVAITGLVHRRGQTSQVQAGPKTGFGLLHSDNGIAFENRQLLTSYTPIRGFNEQVASDPQGRRATKLYTFSAATRDSSEVIVQTVLRTTGLDIQMFNTHNIEVLLGAAPAPGGGFGRLLASLLGQSREAIRQKVYQGAAGEIRQGVLTGSQEESAERAAAAEAEQNARLASFLIGNDTLALGRVAVTQLDLRSRPQFAWVRGTVQWRDGGTAPGADAPKPAEFQTWLPGVTADVHVPSLLTNLGEGFLKAPEAQRVANVLIITRSVPEGGAAQDAVRTVPNADYAALLKAIDEGRASGDPKAVAIRVQRPTTPARFTTDREGHLVALVDNFVLDVPAPSQQGPALLGGPRARVYRLECPRAEFVLAVRFEPATSANPARFAGEVVSFDPGASARILAIEEDESKAAALSPFSGALVLGVARARVQGQALTVPLDRMNVPGLRIRSVTPLRPSGWMRLVLDANLSNLTVPGAGPPR